LGGWVWENRHLVKNGGAGGLPITPNFKAYCARLNLRNIKTPGRTTTTATMANT